MPRKKNTVNDSLEKEECTKSNEEKTLEFDINDYKPEVIEDLQLRFAGNILQTNQIDNLLWAKEFMDTYERKNKKESIRAI